MVTQFADENSRPTTRSVTRSSKNKSFTILNENHKNPQDNIKRSKLKQNGGIRRSALGDVTNRQPGTVVLNDSSKIGLKKSNGVVASKSRVLRKAAPSSLLSPPTDSSHINLSKRKSTSPMCISNDMEEMSIEKSIQKAHDIDSMDQDDANSMWKYAADIFKNFLKMEKTFTMDPNYMHHQLDINSKMRAILVDWLVDVHAKFRLEAQTLYITINILDRYLSKDAKIPRHRLQLMGITSMFIASKYEEIYPPDVFDFVRITDNAYSTEEVFECEELMLRQLGYRVACPTVYQFLIRFLKASGSTSKQTEYFANYIVDRTLQEYKMIKYLPSQIAASAVYIAREQLNEQPFWHSTLEFHTTYTTPCLDSSICEIKQIIWSSYHEIGKMSKLNAVNRKYNKEKYMSVSSIHLDKPEM